jgi:hypothetical protein
VVVVEHEPSVARPVEQVAGEHAGQDVCLLLGARGDRESFHQRLAAPRDERAHGGPKACCERGDVGRGLRSRVPGRRLVAEPLPRQRGLPVSRRGDQHLEAPLARVEQPRQPGPLDDAAPELRGGRGPLAHGRDGCGNRISLDLA